jgi:hypothetical protein
MTKAKAFWAIYWGLLVCYALTGIFARESLPSVGTVIIGALAASGAAYQGANVADNLVKGKHYRAELDAARPFEGG